MIVFYRYRCIYCVAFAPGGRARSRSNVGTLLERTAPTLIPRAVRTRQHLSQELLAHCANTSPRSRWRTAPTLVSLRQHRTYSTGPVTPDIHDTVRGQYRASTGPVWGQYGAYGSRPFRFSPSHLGRGRSGSGRLFPANPNAVLLVLICNLGPWTMRTAALHKCHDAELNPTLRQRPLSASC